MKTILKIGTAEVPSGTVGTGGIAVGRDMFGEERFVPMIVINGSSNGPQLWIVGATHGDEAEGALSILKLLEQVDPRQLKGAIVGTMCLHPDAFAASNRTSPLDMFGQDMNRMYPGRAEGYPAERLAWRHWQLMKEQADLCIAVHSGGNHSYLSPAIFSPQNPESLELAGAMGPDWRVVMQGPPGAGTPYSQLAAQGKGAINAELGGKCRTLGDDFHRVGDTLARGYLNVLRHHGMLPGTPEYAPSWFCGHQIAVLAGATGIWVAERGLPFQERLTEGTPLGRIYDVYGREQAVMRAPADGMIFGLRSEPIVYEGDWTCFYLVIDEERDDLVPRGR